jgi:lathosterol oxidase
MFWSIVSGVTFWTAAEVLYFWAAANGWAPVMTFTDNPVWFMAMFLILPLWSSMHFYWVHRLLHWPPLYKRFHALHHRNISVGPWSGLSMHPVEHLLFFTNIVVHFVLWSHPVHVIVPGNSGARLKRIH